MENSRAVARLAAVQALFQLEATGAGVESTLLEFDAHRLGEDLDGAILHDADRDHFEAVVKGVVEGQRRIDPYIERNLAQNWTLARLDATARAILRAALFELTQRPDIPFRVVIDEYLDVARAFFDEDEPKFINAVLDAAARAARPDEFVKAC
ncbi:MAG: transcription antitermination factor NusB [Pseudomonadota bacterium]